MANEKNLSVAKVAETINGNLVVAREPVKGRDGKQMITREGRPYFSYVVRGKIRGQEKKIDFSPKDQGGYEPLDIIFDISSKAELVMTNEEMTDDKTGKTTAYTSYRVQVYDEDGIAWDCGVKPQRDSDKALLKFLLISLSKEIK